MLRDKNLIPLSHQHQHALALCVRIDRASPIADCDVEAWQKEIAHLFQSEIGVHFAAEEQVLFPAAAMRQELAPLVKELLDEHATLREQLSAAQAGTLAAEHVSRLAQNLSAHIRKEERQLFEQMQQLMDEAELERLGRGLETVLKNAAQTCVVPVDATRLRPAK